MMKKLEINGINFDLPERYEPIKLIGKGTYGAVVSAIDNVNKEKVAIKKLAKIEDMVRTLSSLMISRLMLREFSERSKS
jgi:serine/threonine protein kinase